MTMPLPATKAGGFREVSTATVQLLDQLDPSGAWAVRDAVVVLAWRLDDEHRRALAQLMETIAEAVARRIRSGPGAG